MGSNGERKTRILILDDHGVFREALGIMLAGEADFEVPVTCGSVEEALAAVRESRIDLVLLDLELDGTRGSGFCGLARGLGFAGKVLVLTAGLTDQEAVRLLAEGASGIFLKQTAAGLLPRAIREVMAGRTWIDPRLVPDRPSSGEAEKIESLSEREREVLMGAFEGLANKEIAGRLGISENSVKSALQQIFAKLGVRTRIQLVRAVVKYIGERVR